MNKATRDGLRRTQRRLRDEFASRATSIQASTGAALEAARRAAALAPDAQAARAATVDAEAQRLVAIRSNMRELAARGPMADDLTPRIVALAQEAAADAATDEAARELREVAGRVNGPIRLAIAGKVKAGKSTLLNAIIGEELAPTDAGECTRIVTWYRHSTAPLQGLPP